MGVDHSDFAGGNSAVAGLVKPLSGVDDDDDDDEQLGIVRVEGRGEDVASEATDGERSVCGGGGDGACGGGRNGARNSRRALRAEFGQRAGR